MENPFAGGELNIIKSGLYGNYRKIYTGTGKYSTDRFHNYELKGDKEDIHRRIEEWKKDNGVEKLPETEKGGYTAEYNGLCIVC